MKDNNYGKKSSGASRLRFDFYDEMDEIKRADPNIKPVCVLSSADMSTSSSHTRSSADGESANETTEENEKDDQAVPVSAEETKTKRSKRKYESTVTLSVKALTDWLDDWKEDWEEREDARQQQLDARITRVEQMAKDRNDIYKDMLAELRKMNERN